MPVYTRLSYTRTHVPSGRTEELPFDLKVGHEFNPEVMPWSKARIHRAEELIATWNRSMPATYAYTLHVHFLNIGQGQKPILLDEASTHQIDFLCLAALGLTPYFVNREQVTYIPAGKRTHYKYTPCTNPKQAAALQELLHIGVSYDQDTNADRPWKAHTAACREMGRGKTPSEAIARAFAVHHCGGSAVVPTILG